jgi:hypothetical protein
MASMRRRVYLTVTRLGECVLRHILEDNSLAFDLPNHGGMHTGTFHQGSAHAGCIAVAYQEHFVQINFACFNFITVDVNRLTDDGFILLTAIQHNRVIHIPVLQSSLHRETRAYQTKTKTGVSWSCCCAGAWGSWGYFTVYRSDQRLIKVHPGKACRGRAG